LAAAIEQSHDEKGIIWTKSLAPYDVEIILLGDSEKIQKTAAHLEGECESAGIEVLVDDRDERAGVKFNDADLIGIPIQAIVSERNLKSDQLEIKVRKTGEASQIPLSQSLQKIQEIYESA